LTYDQVGSLRAVADASGNTIKRIDYDSFGSIINDTNPAFIVPLGFACGLHDADIGLVRFGFRDYDPDTGRWTAKDPIGFTGRDMDLYRYCLNDPVNWVDPSGEWIWIPAGAVIGAVVNVAGTYIAYGGDVTSEQLIAAAVSGMVSGVAGAIAGPLGGTLARSLGQVTSGLIAKAFATGISAAGGTIGQLMANVIDPCHQSSLANAALYSGIGGGIASYFPVRSMYTLNQTNYFAPQTLSGLIGSRNARVLLGSFLTSSGVGAGSNFGGPF
jgi:RHS repeat-associated protein